LFNPPEITMHTKTHAVKTTLAAHGTPATSDSQPSEPKRSLPTMSRRTRTTIAVVVAGAVLVVIAITAWNKLQAEFDESFNRFSACPSAALERTA
jgi:L-asparagine transporter-like permease